MQPEYLGDFTWQENKAYADLICEGFKAREIERLEDLAYAAWGEGE